MSDYTVLRVSIEADAVATALNALPGISVVEPDDRPDSGRVDVLPKRDTDTRADTEIGATTEPSFEPAEDDTPTWKEYGLLGVGGSLVLLGIATAGIWWYRRRKGDEPDDWTPESETPAPIDPAAVERPTADVGTPAPADTGVDKLSTDEGDADGQTVLGDEMSGTDNEPPGRTENHDEAEWTTRNISSEDSKSHISSDIDELEPASPTETDEPETTADPRDQVDVAPLLGVAFLAVSGAVVRWVQRAGDAE